MANVAANTYMRMARLCLARTRLMMGAITVWPSPVPACATPEARPRCEVKCCPSTWVMIMMKSVVSRISLCPYASKYWRFKSFILHFISPFTITHLFK